MGKLAVKKYFSFMILIVTVLLMIFTIVGLFGGDVNPSGNTARAMLVYALPLLVIGDFILLVYWLCLRKFHWAIFPFITLLCCIPYIGTIYQFGSIDEKAEAQKGLKIATYNVSGFGGETSGFIAMDILSEMKRQKVDILCCQEYNDFSGDKRNSDLYKEYFPYMAYGQNSRMVIYSRYPIKASAPITFPQSNNHAMWAEIEVEKQTFRVYNVHLETAGAHHVMGRAEKLEEQGFRIQNNRLLDAVYGTYTTNIIKRAGQAEMLANDIRQTKHRVFLAGDCVDVPYSYVYNTLKGEMVDGFTECGSGWMYTLNRKSKLRIDYIFHDKALEGISYYKKDLNYSDHLPVFMKVTMK